MNDDMSRLGTGLQICQFLTKFIISTVISNQVHILKEATSLDQPRSAHSPKLSGKVFMHIFVIEDACAMIMQCQQ